jgi:hypothetical protein
MADTARLHENVSLEKKEKMLKAITIYNTVLPIRL